MAIEPITGFYVHDEETNTDGVAKVSIEAVHEFAEDVSGAVDTWLDEHPEATTTVQDGAITESKINFSFLPSIKNAYVTPEMFGAKGDGVTDDTQAINSAVNFGSKTVIFNNKTYLIKPRSFRSIPGTSNKVAIQVPSNVSIYGNGATIKVDATTTTGNYNVFATTNYKSPSYDSSAEQLYNITIDNLIIDGNSQNLTNEFSLTGMAIYKTDNVILSNIIMKNLFGADGSAYGVIFCYSNNILFDNGIIERSSRSNIYCWESQRVVCKNLKLYGSPFRDCVTCGANETTALQSSSIIFESCLMHHQFDTGTHVARFPKDIDAVLRNCVLIGNNNIDGVAITRANGFVHLTMENCIVKGCAVGVNATGQNAETNITLINNSIIDNTSAFVLGAMTNLKMCGNKISDVSTTNAQINGEVLNIKDNIFKNLYGCTINVANNLLFENNIIDSFTGASYWVIISGNGYSMITGNYCSNVSVAKMRIYSSGKAIGNHFKLDSTSVDTNEYNV